MVAWGLHGAGIVHIFASDNANAISWADKNRDMGGISLKLSETRTEWDIHFKFTRLAAYERAYRNASADALTRHSVGQIEG